MGNKITARFMIQIAGKPVENVEKALQAVLDKLKSEKKKFKLVQSDVIEPELDEESTLYSGVLEVLAKFDDTELLMEFILDYTPTSIEIEDPDSFTFDSSAFTAILNDMSSHILKTSMKLNQAHATLHFLNNKLKELESKK